MAHHPDVKRAYTLFEERQSFFSQIAQHQFTNESFGFIRDQELDAARSDVVRAKKILENLENDRSPTGDTTEKEFEIGGPGAWLD